MTRTGDEPAPPPSVLLHGVELHAITERQCHTIVLEALSRGRGGWIVTPNLEYFRLITHDPTFARICSGADLVVADGMPLVWASRLQGTPIPERVAGSNLIDSLTGAAAAASRSIYLLGGDPGTAERAADVLASRWPGMRLAGTICPAFGFERDASQRRAIVEAVRAADPDIVYVALGTPKQDQFIAAIRHELPRAWWVGVGISFSFLAGDVRRAPAWVQRVGLEWVFRLSQEPSKLAKRYLVRGLPFAASLMGRAALQRIRSRGSRAARPDADGASEDA